MGTVPVAAVSQCISARRSDPEEAKIAAVGRRALMVMAGVDEQLQKSDAFDTANFIRNEALNCFPGQEQKALPLKIAEWMRRAVCREAASGLPDYVFNKVNIQDVNQVSRYLGNPERLDCQ